MLSAVTGFGGAVIVTPLFVAVLGVRDAVAVLTVVQLASNVSRVAFNRHDVDRSIVLAFSAGAVPAAVVGSLLFAVAPAPALVRVVGVFLLVAVVWLRLAPSMPRLGGPAFAGLGAASGLGSALVGSVGPFVAPFFLAQGLVRGAYIGTEAASAVVMHLVKLVVYGAVAVLTTTGCCTVWRSHRRVWRGRGWDAAWSTACRSPSFAPWWRSAWWWPGSS